MCAYYDAGLPCGECECGNEFEVVSCPEGFKVECTCKKEQEHRLKGWVCPVCGVGVSPYITFCPCHSTPLPLLVYYPAPQKPLDYTITCGSSCGL